WLEAMRVYPVAERPLDLPVAKLTAFDVIKMLGHPAYVRRSKRYLKNDPCTVFDTAAAFDDLHLCPRRRQPLQRAGTCVPAKHFLCRRVDSGPAHEQLGRHVLPISIP